jgi:hypothetical protein
MTQAYSDPSRASDPHALPDIEVFYVPAWEQSTKPRAGEHPTDQDGNYLEPGWYWWSCFPGCLPDGDPSGPFDSEAEALADAQAGMED